ncbi:MULTISPECIES: VOC family protein [unclassified Paenibacillus]|uniref:VOC family protein n=1 Tax=unclassified Paenibacillus TaxID=185978 RepID=UPI001C120E55|nr:MULTISPECIES: VOC family protein [unclassified Paenibacillus]MBU5443216.1 VOC family protein [Paenibacillus sp. MSJ-34]CAH0121384.1 hypothetical protein PAE9249_03912 [Paenibacillus sp. CECT 9249]
MIKGLNPYLVFNGNGREAVSFYEKALGAQVVAMQSFGDMPDNPGFEIPEEVKSRVMHALLKVGDTDLMISDTFPGPHETSYQIGSQVTVSIAVSDAETARNVYESLRDGGKVVMELQETFWSPSYGQVTDRFGVTWHVSADAAKQ